MLLQSYLKLEKKQTKKIGDGITGSAFFSRWIECNPNQMQ